MKVFISWSGDRSLALAQALRDWLPLTLQYVSPWLSDVDIAAGERWAPAVAERLEEAEFGIVCLTSENMTAPWILFEAGALAKAVASETRVVPFILGLEPSDVRPPLGQFQAKRANQAGVHEVVRSLNAAASNGLDDATVEQVFAMAWPLLEAKIAAIPDGEQPTAPATRSEGEIILGEILASVRSLEARTRAMEFRSQTPKTSDLSQRDIDVLTWTARGLSGAEVAQRLGVTREHVSHIRSQIQSKLGVRSFAAAIGAAAEMGLLHPLNAGPATVTPDIEEEEENI